MILNAVFACFIAILVISVSCKEEKPKPRPVQKVFSHSFYIEESVESSECHGYSHGKIDNQISKCMDKIGTYIDVLVKPKGAKTLQLDFLNKLLLDSLTSGHSVLPLMEAYLMLSPPRNMIAGISDLTPDSSVRTLLDMYIQINIAQPARIPAANKR